MIIRDEHKTELSEISRIVAEAFGGTDESLLIERLREDGDAVVSLVAVIGDAIAGHVMLSPMTAPFDALGLAPLSVRPEYQKQGAGTALVRAAITRAREMGASAIFVLGDPEYYGRFGFRADLATGFSSPYAGRHFMVLPLASALESTLGQVDYAPAFSSLA
ncbi:N-acetyltransferase [Rhizobium sp. S96]|uniref:GNAT family N-acetyltransferase n=1 Tax=Rhizobium sp. S96 TaxID=3055140 RepID=UPI0025AAE810|nr:N-acetyltransferase [Rhizobium sp. S96]MDM9623486.1 N-acetyltransferase [Rhizobium sp. S96]